MKHQNQLAIKLLHKFGNSKPTEKHIKLIEQLLLSKNSKYQNSLDHALTEREISFLYWIAKGKSCEQIALLFGNDLNIIRHYSKSIRNKLDCRTLAHAIYEAIRLGYLLPNIDIKLCGTAKRIVK